MISETTKTILLSVGSILIGVILGVIVYFVIKHFRKSDDGGNGDDHPQKCQPNCKGNECGLDPECGTSNCGSCSDGKKCENGKCVGNTPSKCTPDGHDMKETGVCLPCCENTNGYLGPFKDKKIWNYECLSKNPGPPYKQESMC